MRLGTILGALALLLPLAAPAGAQTVGERAFRSDMIKRVQAKLPDAEVTPDPDDFLALHVKGGVLDGATINLHRIYEYCAGHSAEDCETLKQDFTGKMTSPNPDPTVASLRLMVRDRVYLENLLEMERRSAAEGKNFHYVYEQIGEDLFAILVSDAPDKVAILPDDSLKDLGLTRKTAWAKAAKQTRDALPPLPKPDQLKASAVAFQEYEYLPSLLLDLPAWARIAEAVGPDLFVTAVSDGFVFAGTMPDDAVAEFAETVAEDCAEQERCISPHIYRFRDGRWVIARAPGDGASR
ncbi:hypothetical protein ACFQ1E_00675 [Sphingomonas canadensis]|uniref:DUF1444 family protein n=1 Tax=Sphingomonas canadensis TaxID=1219257 RepID=A0ABW3H6C8_9SPHN|nr:hypothetical protein [Sphingomonas canadensis]MCW3835247.1 hypothetical protein [Sphingomonas canadensis]